MINILLSAVPLLLMGSNPAVEWAGESKVKVSAVFDASNSSQMFKKGQSTLDALAAEACEPIGEAKIEGEIKVSSISVSPTGKPQATLFAIYNCV